MCLGGSAILSFHGLCGYNDVQSLHCRFIILSFKRGIAEWLLWSQAALDAQMLAKRPGPDVRERKRRHFNFIGKLLREVEPELMDALIEATKDGNHSRLRALSVSKVWFGKDDDEEEEDFEQEQEEEEYREHSSIASRWFDGLISKDIQMATEVFSIHAIDFDRQSIYSILNNSMSAI
ncbi:uncharacterized protein LOC104416376 isoform X2 [Eucalyptus grandis]|uniref:uncharacterized protein LOC104416376 isoform X2 n=1 Tax=Eucalyptus grandis TaxID=71139 RepID=UPI00192E7752|nr:uncharacterized protein LOC104416376 isoform X2 [Eucalyptus grandis]